MNCKQILIISLFLAISSKCPAWSGPWEDYSSLNKQYEAASKLAIANKNKESIAALKAVLDSIVKFRKSLATQQSIPNEKNLAQQIGLCEAKCHRLLAEIYHKENDLKSVEFHFGKAIPLQSLFGTYEGNELENDYQYLATVCESNGNIMEASSCYDTILRLREQRLGKDSKELIIPLKNLIKALNQLNEFSSVQKLEKRLQNLEKAH